MTSAIVPLLTMLAVPLLLAWMVRGQAGQITPGTLAYGARARLFAALSLVGPPIGIGVLVALDPVPLTPPQLVPVFMLVAFFVALALPLAVEFYLVRITYDDRGIHVASPWSPARTLLWGEIAAVRWRQNLKWLDLSDGSSVVHVTPMFTGLGDFAKACRASVTEAVLSQDPEVASVLTLMERGRSSVLVLANVRPSLLLGPGA